jgi:fucose permease
MLGRAANANRLFVGSCMALVATSVAFATLGAVMLDLKAAFVLDNAQVGWIGGAALWGFAVSQLIFAPLADTRGMRWLLKFAWLGHLAGTLVMMTAAATGPVLAGPFWSLFVGALVIAMANGLVEAACNPLVATLYPTRKTAKLNQFHVWFPGGIVLGGLASYGLDAAGVGAWEVKLGLILIPTVLYGVLLLGEVFPETEGVQAGVSMGDMFRASLATPLMWLMLLAMAMTASVELGPNRWVPAVLEAGGMAGILVLVWINGLMAVLRFRASAILSRLSPIGILMASAVVSGLGLTWLSYTEGGAATFAAASVFAVGVCYFWPTMLGVVSERIPKSGALGLGLMGAVGMATVGLFTAPAMGRIADDFANERFDPQATVAFLMSAADELSGSGVADDEAAARSALEVVAGYSMEGSLPSPATANALRSVISSEASPETLSTAQSILGPADNYGGRISFRYVAPLSAVLLVIFAGLYLMDAKRGGYRATRLSAAGPGETIG